MELQKASIDKTALGDNTKSLKERLEILKPMLNDAALLSKFVGVENSNAARPYPRHRRSDRNEQSDRCELTNSLKILKFRYFRRPGILIKGLNRVSTTNMISLGFLNFQ